MKYMSIAVRLIALLSFFCMLVGCGEVRSRSDNNNSSIVEGSAETSSDTASIFEEVKATLPENLAAVVPETEADKTASAALPAESETEEKVIKVVSSDEMRAVWLPFMELEGMLKGKSASEFKKEVNRLFDKYAKHRLNTVIVHARSHADAFYKSSIFPTSVYFTGERSDARSVPYDPLAVMVEAAHKRGLKIEAWINPYRGARALDESFPENEKMWKLMPGEPISRCIDSGMAFRCGEYYYFDPGAPEVQQLVLDGVKEILQNYQVDGIHFDDYFYPSGCGEFDSARYGDKTKKEFRTESVNKLVSAVYALAHASGRSFGISPAGNLKSCCEENYADVKLWGKSEGYVDYLAPQLYWNYNELNSLPYSKALKAWEDTVTASAVKLYVGLAVYKTVAPGSEPEGWTEGNILSRQVTEARAVPQYGGFMLYRSCDYFSEACAVERAALESILY